jgi:pilus assembly protein CpaB
MKPMTLILFVVAVCCSLAAGYLAHRLFEKPDNEPRSYTVSFRFEFPARPPRAEPNQSQSVVEPKMKVLVAKKKIYMLTLLKKPEDYFVEKEMPLEAVPKKAIKSFDELGKGKDAKRVNKMMNEDAMLTTDDLVSRELDGITGSLKPDNRAIAIKVDQASLVGGFVLPGSRVDVVSIVREGNDGPASEIILQDMLVLGVDIPKPDGRITALAGIVTLSAMPEEAMKLTLASNLGELRLLLRSAGDHEIKRTPTIKQDQLKTSP